MYEVFIFHLLFEFSTVRKKNAAIFTDDYGKWLSDTPFDMYPNWVHDNYEQKNKSVTPWKKSVLSEKM